MLGLLNEYIKYHFQAQRFLNSQSLILPQLKVFAETAPLASSHGRMRELPPTDSHCRLLDANETWPSLPPILPFLQRSVQPPRILACCDEPMANGKTDPDKHPTQ